MKYLLLTYLDEKKWLALSAAEQQRLMEECGPHVQKLLASGKMLQGAPLHPTDTARTVRVQGGRTMVTDGPFAETREQLGGYTLLEADSMEEAVEIAKGFQTPDSIATIEVRQVVDLERMPGS